MKNANGAAERGGASSPPADTAGVPLPPPLLFVGGLLAGFGLEVAVPIEGPSTEVAIAVAVVFGLAWFVLDGVATTFFLRAGTSPIPFKPSTALVTSGPYKFTRNPMYVGMACAYIALAVPLGLIWALVLLPLVILAVDRLVIAREEPYLERKFGSEYRAYKARVRRWL